MYVPLRHAVGEPVVSELVVGELVVGELVGELVVGELVVAELVVAELVGELVVDDIMQCKSGLLTNVRSNYFGPTTMCGNTSNFVSFVVMCQTSSL